jgi:hypothetical protein
MPKLIVSLKKMSTMLDSPVQYTLTLDEANIPLNILLGQTIQLHHTGQIHCVQCHRKTNKSFQQGYCFPCYRRLLECGLCIIHPEKCRYYETDICKPNDWAHAHCSQPHVVYLANSSGLKVGITRASHFKTRWIDQGATQGLVIFKTQNRHQAGLLEVILKQYVADKTNWQAMLKADHQALDLLTLREQLLAQGKSVINDLIGRFPTEIQPAIDEEIVNIQYPMLQYPLKIKTFNLDKEPFVEGVLQGIKGQYLILDTGVISIRKFSGYQVAWGQD